MKKNLHANRYHAVAAGGAVDPDHPSNQFLSAWLAAPPGLPVAGSRLLDLGGKCHGTLTNFDVATPYSSGWLSNNGWGSLALDATDDFVEVSKLPTVVLTDAVGFSMSGWFRPNTIDSTWRTVAAKVNSDNTNRQFSLTINGGYSATTDGLSLFTRSDGDGAVGTGILTVGRTYYFHASHLGTGAGGNALWVFSREGGFEVAAAGSAGPTNTGIDADAGTNTFRIGRFNDAEPNPLGGVFGGIRFFNRAKHTFAEAAYEINQWRHNFQTPDSPLRWISTRTWFVDAGGGATTRGTPFGHRGTAFNGGRTFLGNIR